MVSRLVIVVALVATGLALASGRAEAQDAAAEVLFRDGDRLMRDGKIAEACTAFEGSNRVEARAGTLLRLGDCREKNQQLASAWSAYVDALARAKDPEKQRVAQGKVAALEPRLSRLTIKLARPVVGIAITRDDQPVDPALVGRAVPVDGGRYTLRATAPGFEPWTTMVEVPVERGMSAVTVPALKAAPESIVELSTAETAPVRPTGLTGRRKAAIVFGVVAVGAGAAGVVLGLQARELQDEAAAICPAVMCVRADEANRTLDRARDRALYSNIGYGVGGAALVAGAILWVTGGATAREGRVAIIPTVRGAAVVGRF